MAHLRQKYKWIDEFEGKNVTLVTTPIPFIEIHFDNSQIGDKLKEHSQYRTTLPFACSQCFSAPIVDVRQLVNASACDVVKNVYELTMKVANVVLPYRPGDTIGILPVNPDDVVQQIIDRNAELKTKCKLPIRLKLAESSVNSKKSTKMPIYFTTATTSIYKLLKETIDLNAMPKKAMLVALAKSDCVSNPIEKRFLEILASRDGAAIYVAEILQNQTSFMRLFDDLRSMSFTVKSVTILLEHLPRLMPRPYSISTSALATKSLPEYDRHSTLLKIMFSVNDPPGITTRMLEQLIFKYQVENTLRFDSNEENVNLFVRQSNRFRLSDDDFDRPLILIAIGTGIAPFIGFLEHRREQRRTLNRPPGRTWLLFGCRQRANQLCRSQLKEYLACGILNRLTETFSRDTDATGERYVQDKIKAHADEFVKWFDDSNNESKTFICGSTKMAQDVRCAIEECLMKVNKTSAPDAKAFIDDAIKNGRYVEDIWI